MEGDLPDLSTGSLVNGMMQASNIVYSMLRHEVLNPSKL